MATIKKARGMAEHLWQQGNIITGLQKGSSRVAKKEENDEVVGEELDPVWNGRRDGPYGEVGKNRRKRKQMEMREQISIFRGSKRRMRIYSSATEFPRVLFGVL